MAKKWPKIGLSDQKSLKIGLNNEIKKGNFLIGLRQYLGGENDTFHDVIGCRA